jgi:quercetin dioxygenase-like cupin family protein
MSIGSRAVLSGLVGAILSSFAALTAAQESVPRPVEVALMSFPITVAAGDYALVNSVLDLPVGSGLPQHYHSGPVVVTVITGELTVVDAAGERVVRAGESWTENPGDKHAIMNKSAAMVRVASSALFPKGAPRTRMVK